MKLTDSFFARAAEAQQRRDRTLVHGNARSQRWMFARLAVVLFGGLGLLWVADRYDHTFWGGLASGFMGAFVALAALSGWRAASSYRNGWYEARKNLIVDELPLLLRGEVAAEDWYARQLARDVALFASVPEDVFRELDDFEQQIRRRPDDDNGR